jgi:hypothetical protein
MRLVISANYLPIAKSTMSISAKAAICNRFARPSPNRFAEIAYMAQRPWSTRDSSTRKSPHSVAVPADNLVELEGIAGCRDAIAQLLNTSNNNDVMLLEELRRLETELHTTDARRNRQRMETLLHADFVEFGRSCTRYTRADVLNEFGPTSVLPSVCSGNFDLAVLAEGIALLTYASAHEDAEGKQSRHTLRSSVWVRTDSRWQMRFLRGRQLQPEPLMSNRRVAGADYYPKLTVHDASQPCREAVMAHLRPNPGAIRLSHKSDKEIFCPLPTALSTT